METNIKRTSDKQAMRGQVDHMQILLIDKSGLQIGLLKVYMLNYIFSVFSDCILILSTCNAMEVVSFAIDGMRKGYFLLKDGKQVWTNVIC